MSAKPKTVLRCWGAGALLNFAYPESACPRKKRLFTPEYLPGTIIQIVTIDRKSNTNRYTIEILESKEVFNAHRQKLQTKSS